MHIVRADPSHEPQILSLATRTLGWDDDPRFAELYRWKHDRNPIGPSPRWVALEDDRVVGFRVLLRWRFRRPDGSVAQAVRAVDTATDPDFQGRGIFRSLTLAAIEELAGEGVDFVFNTPNDQSRPGYLKMGWEELGTPPVAVAPRVAALPRIVRARTAAELWSEPTDAGTAAIEYFGDAQRATAAAERLAGERGVWKTDRTPAWLRWRYGLEPLHYRVLADGDGALAVFRLRRRGAALEATVTELAAASGAARRRLLRRVLRSSGADYVLFASAARLDPTPALSLPQFSPLVTWRRLTDEPKPALDGVRLSVGDLELF